MVKSNEVQFEPEFFEKIFMVAKDLATIINQNKGLRIGQSTVCSQKMHTYHSEKPQEVNVLQDIDAGQSFYHRSESGSVYHLDIFHECGMVDHHIAAVEMRSAVDLYNAYYDKYRDSDMDDKVKADFFDIQTSTGGGRITGSLDYGKKMSLRKGHTNHVHITMALPQKHLACVVYVIMAVENVILSCNLELRRNEKVKNVKGTSKGKIDMSAYADKSDSLLQKDNTTEIHDGDVNNQDPSDLIDGHNTAQELKEFPKRDYNNGHKPIGGVNSHRGVESLEQGGMIELSHNSKNLNKSGKQDEKIHEKFLPEIEVHLRQVIRNAKSLFAQSGRSKKMLNKISCLKGKNIIDNTKAGHECGEVNISESISVVARRMVEKNEKIFKITHEDLRYSVNRKRQKIEFCLLIDASSSMEGERIRAAKKLARFLFLSTADRISVIVFQENKAWVQVPFTRDLSHLEERLKEIKTYGRTPLALGLTACIQYLEKNKIYNPLIILITDGVPTLGTKTTDPVYDALEVAKRIKVKRYGFTCIGLKPHLDYLNQLSKIAGGSIYVVDELDKVGTC